MSKKKSHEEQENALSFEKEDKKENKEETMAPPPAHVTPGTLVKYFIRPGEKPLAAFVASVDGDKVSLMVLELTGVPTNATEVPFVTGTKAPPYPDLHYCALP